MVITVTQGESKLTQLWSMSGLVEQKQEGLTDIFLRDNTSSDRMDIGILMRPPGLAEIWS